MILMIVESMEEAMARPYGAKVSGVGVEHGHGEQANIVGRIFARGRDDESAARGKWGNGPVEQCRISYSLPKRDPKAWRTGFALAEVRRASSNERR
jgi:outer membrane usher protein FimD/PapC